MFLLIEFVKCVRKSRLKWNHDRPFGDILNSSYTDFRCACFFVFLILTNIDSNFDIYVSYYILDLEELVITNYTQSGDIMCGCDACYSEDYDVVARVE